MNMLLKIPIRFLKLVRIRNFGVTALSVFVLLMAVGCHRSQNDSGQYNIVLADVANIENALVTVAERQGLFNREGVNVQRRTFTSGKQALEAMVGGQADLATSAETPIVWASLRGEQISIIATLNETVNKATAVRAAGIQRPEDLKNKRVGFLAGTSAEFWMEKLLRQHGISRTDLQLINLEPPQMVAALTGKPPGVDAFFAWEPHNQSAKKVVGQENVVEFSSAGMYTEFFSVSTRRDSIVRNAEAYRRFLRALLAAETYLKGDASYGQEVMANFLKLDKLAVRQLWEENTYHLTLQPGLISELREIREWAMRSTSASPDARVFDERSVVNDVLLREVAGDRSKLNPTP